MIGENVLCEGRQKEKGNRTRRNQSQHSKHNTAPRLALKLIHLAPAGNLALTAHLFTRSAGRRISAQRPHVIRLSRLSSGQYSPGVLHFSFFKDPPPAVWASRRAQPPLIGAPVHPPGRPGWGIPLGLGHLFFRV